MPSADRCIHHLHWPWEQPKKYVSENQSSQKPRHEKAEVQLHNYANKFDQDISTLPERSISVEDIDFRFQLDVTTCFHTLIDRLSDARRRDPRLLANYPRPGRVQGFHAHSVQ